MKNCLSILLFTTMFVTSNAQWTGSYEGVLNGDKILVTLVQSGKDKISGEMSDSYQKFKITGDVNGNRMAGDAVEQTLGLKFALLGEIKGNSIDFKLVANILGLKSETPFAVTKIKATSSAKGVENTQKSTVSAKGQTRDQRITGRWTKNESYNSGYGDNFMGANFSQSIFFLEDGGIADGGSNASISGSNYSGRSSGKGNTQAVPGATWYTKDNQLFISYTNNGQTQTESLGKYYIENGKMLLTLANGKKVLLTR